MSTATPPGLAVCRAPSASMYLDQHGDVRACCQNAGFPLGNVAEASLVEIWRGSRAGRLREAVAAGDLSLGCDFCAWRGEDASGEGSFARTFDHLRVPSVDPVWPQQLELSLSNACNLQCVMCNGDWSSSIRIHREGRAPLPVVYDEAFFEDLAVFLPHVEVVKFLGGEPFLGAESLRVMEMLAELGTGVRAEVTTNGTQWSPRIERILDRLDVRIAISLDAVHRDTYESIRIGADFDAVMANVERFLAHCTSRETVMSFSHCLMTSNWHEFDDFLRFAQEREADVFINTVTDPHDLSLYHLHPTDLRHVVDELDRRESKLVGTLSGSREHAWFEQLAVLRCHGQQRADETPVYLSRPILGGLRRSDPPPVDDDVVKEILQALDSAVFGPVLTVDPYGTITHMDLADASSLEGVDLARMVGQPVAAVYGAFAATHGSGAPEILVDSPTAQHWRVAFAGPSKIVLHGIMAAEQPGGPGSVELKLYLAVERSTDPAAAGEGPQHLPAGGPEQGEARA